LGAVAVHQDDCMTAGNYLGNLPTGDADIGLLLSDGAGLTGL
jgi:hypothetical protein